MLLARPNLTRHVADTAALHSLTAVVAPMGYGKTTLARELCRALPGTACYYAVPAGPHDGRFLWLDIGSGYEAQGLGAERGIGAAMRRLGLPETASQARQALEYLRALGKPECPVWLLIDDYHHATDPLFDAFWRRVATEDVPHLHVILLSRTRPGVNLEELCLKRRAALLDQSLLVFSPAETEAFFRENGVENPDAAAEAQRYSEGWPAALWLCLQSWKAGGGAAAPGDIDSLLANAVFAAYSRDEQDLLLRLSVFEFFTGEDAERIAAYAGWLPVGLMELRRKNAFLSFDARTGFHQFHGIFRDFLRKRLAATAHVDKPGLYRLAGECCFERRDHVNAFRLFHKAGRDEDLLRLLDTFRRFAEDRNVAYFAEERFRAAMSIPWRVRLQNPMGWLAVIGTRVLTGKDRGAAPLIDEAEERFRAAEEIPPGLKQRLLGEIEVVRGLLAFNDPDRMLPHYAAAARLLNGPSRFVSEKTAWNIGSPNQFFITLREPGTVVPLEGGGYATRMEETWGEIIRANNILSGGQMGDAVRHFNMECLLERGEFSEAEALLAAALPGRGDSGRECAAALAASFGLARLAVATGRAGEALPLLEAVRPRVEALDHIGFFTGFDIATGYVASVLGRHDAIPRWLRDGEVFNPPHNSLSYIFGFSLTVYGRALLLRGEYRRLAGVAGDIPGASPAVSLCGNIHGKMLQAVAAWHMQGQGEALALLEEALDLSRPDSLVLLPAEYGRHVLPLLRLLKRRGSRDPHMHAVLALAERIGRGTGGTGRVGQANRSGLTPREQEILRHVAKGETNPVIAAQLHISVNAVKAMLSKACAKLGAFNRLDAAQRFGRLHDDSTD